MNRADWLVAAQAAALTGIVWPGRARWALPPVATATAGLLVAGGAALAVAGVRPLGPHVTPRVAPPPGAQLVTTGAYAVTRNPIYTGLLAGSVGMAVLRRRPAPLVSAGLLGLVLGTKVRLEERALEGRFGSRYRAYAARTPRLVPRRRPPG
ncbi:methyltransferase family protein [Georgenia yuyongxinii]|uniref:Isoprenylcysteine carboxylmethyltransferase family protein n=1 Tax=Georgenia yuyongxinii TaxID=2589797 RepID=A0A552WME8_9MICO|nr:isoprenylcysteine carboxylmethyltransferase family protein [Georgenia yuyongxinii]TRW43673.1 isoprenylcysteine carboxylmethyltransferase family protein [Georgenia yuyongxinii]